MNWKYIEQSKPSATESGNWDGLKSGQVLVFDTDGECHVVEMYEGYMDGSYFCEFVGVNDNQTKASITHWCEIESPNIQSAVFFTEKQAKDFVINLRKKQKDIEQKISFCKQHNFRLEAESKRNEADVVQSIIHEMENEFDLGFVWDSSLD